MRSVGLRGIPGYKGHRFRFGTVTLVASPSHEPPFTAQIRVLEEDTWRLLSVPSEIPRRPEHPIRLMTDLVHDRPASPGTVLTSRRGWLAVVYDLDQEPVCRESWVADASRALLRKAEQAHCRSLALPLLGHAHGDLPWRRSLDVVIRALREHGSGARTPLLVWLQIPAALRGEIVAALVDLNTQVCSPRPRR